MVKLKSIPASPSAWVEGRTAQRGKDDTQLLHAALLLSQDKDPTLLLRGTHIAEILLSLDLDSETLAAALIYPLFQLNEIHHDTVAEKFGDRVRKILVDGMQMQSLERFNKLADNQHNQIENLRKILLAMVTDIRAVIIILAERLVMLREAKTIATDKQVELAKQTMKVYAPLANRLGIWQLKWEMEDLCLRYLEPDTYKSIATGLANKRIEREEYIKSAMDILNKLLQQNHINDFKVSGRIKHIYSIYAKMKRKGANLDQIYDVSAMRVLLPTIDDCYTVMGVLHHTWQHIPAEFDDYISKPKPNGYQSIHTVLVGPENKIVEIQIRTYDMHDTSELGVASHWSYKENIKTTANYEEKIALLRQVMAWQNEIVTDPADKNVQVKDLFSDRVYVFTPLGDIIDLPSGATPIDFAYAVHSEIGHRCRGAKVNGKLVQLTYPLQTGERIEIQTTKVAHPSRDWLNPHKGYIKTVRARNHIQHWFRTNEPTEKPITHETDTKIVKAKPKLKLVSHGQPSKPFSQNVSNYLTKFSRCCKPLPGDSVIGYITQKAGLSVHRLDCSNFLYLKARNPERVLEIEVADRHGESFPVDLEITGNQNAKLLNAITTSLANANIQIVSITDTTNKSSLNSTFLLTTRIHSMDDLHRCISLLNHISDVIEVKRR